MAANKTTATNSSPSRYIAAIADESRRLDCQALLDLMARASRQPAVMWGSAIVGFGVHKYALSGGKQGEICAVGFSSRKGDLSIYGVTGHPDAADLLAKLGRHKMGKGCLYVSHLADIDLEVLGKLVAQSIESKQA